VACANVEGQADSNNSQFFITLDRCDHLDRHNTIFGRVAGESIFAVARLAEVEVDASDRPVDPPKVVSSEVLWPPFDDIVPRTTPAQRREEVAAAAQAKKVEEIRQRKLKGACPNSRQRDPCSSSLLLSCCCVQPCCCSHHELQL
jgi:cyclophilin family peptidyl-prolyl cis-trans isomerase